MCVVYVMNPGAFISKRNGMVCIWQNHKLSKNIPIATLEGLVLMDKVQISSQLVAELLEKKIPTTWVSSRGRFHGHLESYDAVHVFRQRQQVLEQGTLFALEISKKVVSAKIHNQITLLRRYNRLQESPHIEEIIQQMGYLQKNVPRTVARDKIMGYEGSAARLYFSAFGELVSEPFTFHGRNKRPPKDAVNAMLSFGYTLLFQEVYTAICTYGMNPYFGFLHTLRNHHPALASDLMEEWRAILIDSMVLSIIRRHEMDIQQFHPDEVIHGIYMTKAGRAVFLKAYEKKLRSHNSYQRGTLTFRESMRRQVETYSQALMKEDSSLYEPVQIR